MNKSLFMIMFFKVAYTLLHLAQSRNKNKRPNNNNDVITDLGGGGNFPMFRFTPRIRVAMPASCRARVSPTSPPATPLERAPDRG
jgi:hypothetical protein